MVNMTVMALVNSYKTVSESQVKAATEITYSQHNDLSLDYIYRLTKDLIKSELVEKEIERIKKETPNRDARLIRMTAIDRVNEMLK